MSMFHDEIGLASKATAQASDHDQQPTPATLRTAAPRQNGRAMRSERKERHAYSKSV